MPAAGHIVHMPSHVYMRVGRYADATDANRRAVAVDRAYLAAGAPDGVYPMMYVPHNVHFLWSSASMEGRSAEAIAAARELDGHLSPDVLRAMPMLEYYAPTSTLAFVRFGRWSDVLAAPEPAPEFAFLRGMWLHARGLALAATDRTAEAEAALAELERVAAAVPVERVVGDNQPAVVHLRLAAAVLGGEIAARRGRTDDALRALEEAARIEDRLPYTEPPPWYQPVRHRLGAVLLRAGRAGDAEAVYREDLRHNPDNGWALTGLVAALRAQGRRDEATAVDGRRLRAWARADVTLAGSVL
jgi:tetratricopeptide (TPR) repeat protein